MVVLTQTFRNLVLVFGFRFWFHDSFTTVYRGVAFYFGDFLNFLMKQMFFAKQTRRVVLKTGFLSIASFLVIEKRFYRLLIG